MPHYSPITKSELDGAPSTLLDYPDSSNREPTISKDDDSGYFSRCRWYGEEFFKFSLKMAVFMTAKRHTTADDLKLELTQVEINFPYQDFTEKLDAMKATKVPRHFIDEKAKTYITFITKLGAVVDKVDHDTRNRLALMIQSQGGIASVGASADDAMLSSSPPPGDISVVGDKSIALCSMRLQEWAAEKQKSISWKGKKTSVDPPLSEVTVLVDGESFIATAKKQSMAKHIACKEACERFEIMD